MSNTSIPKIKGRFYPLQHEEWLQACQVLTPSERDVLYYVRTLDPYNNGIEINTAQIARDLSTENKVVHRQTISRALKKLGEKGFIDLELLRVKVKVSGKGLWCVETPKVCEDTQVDHHTPKWITTHPSGSPHTEEDPEALPAKGSALSKTYLDFLKTLSEPERENFLEFGRKKASQLPRPPELPDRWVAANWEELRSQWESSAVGRQIKDEAAAAAMDWANHPHFDEWLNKCYFVGRLWTMEDSPDQAERSAFFKWAQKTNAYVGRIDGAT